MKATGPACLAAGLLCFGAAAWQGSPQLEAGLELGRGLARPLVMPYLLDGLLAAQRRGNIAEAAQRGRSLMRLMPAWTDGHILVAGFMSQAADSQELGRDEALQRLFAACTILREAMHLPGTDRGALQQAMAQELILRVTLAPELQDAWQQATGQNPYQQAADWLREVPGYQDSPQVQAELAFCLIDGLPLEIRLGRGLPRLLQMVDSSAALLDRLEDRELASAWAESLRNLRSYLNRSVDISLDELATDPRLEKIAAALRARAPR